jgi:hypothetical protein
MHESDLTVRMAEKLDKLGEAWFSRLDDSALLRAHFIMCTAGMLVFAMFLGHLLGKAIPVPVHLISGLYGWAQPHAGHGKIITLMQYMVPVAMLVLYLPLTHHYADRLASSRAGNARPLSRLWVFFLISFLINLGLLLANKDKVGMLGLLGVIWLLIFLWLPVSMRRDRWLSIPAWILGEGRTVKLTMLAVLLASYGLIFVLLISNPVVVGQDYVHISQRTILKDGTSVDNLEYINQHRIAGLQIYDPRKSADGIRIKTHDCEQSRRELVSRDGSNQGKVLCGSDGDLLVKAPFVIWDGQADTTPLAAADEEDFIRRNSLPGLAEQVKQGWFLFHHGYNFGPMSALSLGASAEQQTMVYGWLSTVAQGKFLEATDNMSYPGYFKLFYALYLAYFAMFLAGVWLIFRNLATVVFAAALVVTAVLTLQIGYIQLAPGFNPVRHFFDVPAFYFLYRGLAEKRSGFMLMAAGLALFAILWSKDLGLFLATSTGGALLLYGWLQRPYVWSAIFMGGMTVLGGLWLYAYPLPGANPTSIYMLLGVGAPTAEPGEIFNALILMALMALTTFRMKQSVPFKFLTIAMAFYCSQGVTYYIWYPELHHIWGVAPVFILWMAALYHGWINRQEKSGKLRPEWVLVPLFVLLYLPAQVHFQRDLKAYQERLGNHELYQWTFERASIRSTMDPALFEEAVRAIQKYEKGNGLYIISRYDHILPVLAGKYSAMPFNELQTNLVSPREVEAAAEAILEGAPEYIFVDSDIGRNYVESTGRTESIDYRAESAGIKLQQMYGEGVARERLAYVLDKVYRRVAERYTKCETTGLISVYRRITG